MAVVGHVEWVEFARVEHVPRPGEIVQASEVWAEAAGGGAVAAGQLARLAGSCLFLTVLGDDQLGERARADLSARAGLELAAARRDAPQRRAFTFLDACGERTITVLGERIVPRGEDALPWSRLADVDAVYFTGGDVAALRAARQARLLVATPRARETLIAGAVPIDVLVASATDASERYSAGQLRPEPRWVVRTAGAEGGRWVAADGHTGHWRAAALPGPRRDSYGCGDSFAAGLTYGLAAGRSLPDALELAARCGASCLAGSGPYAGQLELS